MRPWWSPKAKTGFIPWSAVSSWKANNNLSSEGPKPLALHVTYDVGGPSSALVAVMRMGRDPKAFREMSQVARPYLGHVNPNLITVW
jgi:hypothetical protein